MRNLRILGVVKRNYFCMKLNGKIMDFFLLHLIFQNIKNSERRLNFPNISSIFEKYSNLYKNYKTNFHQGYYLYLQ